MPVFKRGSVTINYEVRGSGHPLLLLAASVAPITSDDGWQVYLEDQLALMDHLGGERFHVMGGCIGSSYALGLCEAASDRVTAAVLQNPIGLTAENRPKFYAMFDEWADEMRSTHPEVDDRVETSFRNRMFGGDFVFSVDRDFVRSSQIPLMVMPGGDDFHPRAVAEEIVALAPDSVLLSPWGGDEHRGQTLLRVAEFLGAHTPN